MIACANAKPVAFRASGQAKASQSERLENASPLALPILPGASITTRKLRIALIASSYSHIRDGVALTLNRLVEYLERNGVEVLIFAPVGKTPAIVHNGTLVPVGSAPLPFRPEYRVAWFMSPSVRKKLREFNPDIVHVTSPDILGYSALKLAQKLKIPVVASYHTRFETY